MNDADVREQVGFVIAEAARALRGSLDRRLRPLGMSQAQWRVLVHLNMAPGGLVQKELANRVGVEGPTLVRLLDRMAAQGWIERRPSDADRRSNTVHLTAKASGLLDRIMDTAEGLREEILADIPQADLECCIRTLRRIRERADEL